MKYGKNIRIKWTVIIIVILICLYIHFGHENVRRKDDDIHLNLKEESESKPQKLTSPKTNETEIPPNLPVYFWIDIPNDFPWRNCLQEYNKALTPLHCNEVSISTYMKASNYSNFRK